MNSSLSREYGLKELLTFAAPNMFMMLFLALYTIVDGTFVSWFVGTDALSSINMVYPVISCEMAIAIMLATGGNAIIARRMGEKKNNLAIKDFSFIILIETLIGLAVAFFGLIFINDIIRGLGATNVQFELSKNYLTILLTGAPFFMLQTAFQTFFVTAGRPETGLLNTVISGLLNMVLDYVFIAIFGMGIEGAAYATVIGYLFSAIAGVVFFMNKKHELHLTVPVYERGLLVMACRNGSSEMVSNMANAITTFLFNYTFLKYYGEDGVAAITIILYIQYIFTAIYFGYSNGIAPIVAYKYGEKNRFQIRNIYKHSLTIVNMTAVVSVLLIWIFSQRILSLFVAGESRVFEIALDGLKKYAIAFLIMGNSIFASAWFTALSNGKVSAIISFLRTLVFIVAAILLLPAMFGAIGAWYAIPFAEAGGLIVSLVYLQKNKPVYGYGKA